MVFATIDTTNFHVNISELKLASSQILRKISNFNLKVDVVQHEIVFIKAIPYLEDMVSLTLDLADNKFMHSLSVYCHLLKNLRKVVVSFHLSP